MAGQDETIDQSVTRAQAGDPNAFADLVRRTSRMVFAAAARIVGDAALAEDIAQETFFRAWRNLSRLESPAAFGGWVRTIAVRLAFDQVRDRTKLTFFPDGPPDRPAPDNPERQAADSGRRRRVMAELSRLDPDYAEAVAMIDLEGLSYEEASAALGIGLSNLKIRVHRGRKILRDSFAHQGILKSEDA